MGSRNHGGGDDNDDDDNDDDDVDDDDNHEHSLVISKYWSTLLIMTPRNSNLLLINPSIQFNHYFPIKTEVCPIKIEQTSGFCTTLI